MSENKVKNKNHPRKQTSKQQQRQQQQRNWVDYLLLYQKCVKHKLSTLLEWCYLLCAISL